ncbi:hypothetical protein P7K49_037013 [Saguinus oedipus]|uniref:Uncharacterized protein n=1 Tax=Saguinus oedipus TaxID=9490 RepID=A0ABQ9TLS6_SAGOE|nr:hypothetical protein P7K49_037013 [Saguinus oedipus]
MAMLQTLWALVLRPQGFSEIPLESCPENLMEGAAGCRQETDGLWLLSRPSAQENGRLSQISPSPCPAASAPTPSWSSQSFTQPHGRDQMPSSYFNSVWYQADGVKAACEPASKPHPSTALPSRILQPQLQNAMPWVSPHAPPLLAAPVLPGEGSSPTSHPTNSSTKARMNPPLSCSL